MWNPICDVYSPDAEKKIKLKYRLKSDNSQGTIWFREQAEKDNWLKENGKYITIQDN